jgi:response regulator NasT
MSEELQRENEALRHELAKAKLKLAERVYVERAKGLLMKLRGLDEDNAYRALRRMAMDSNLRIGEIARRFIEQSA